MSLIVVYVVEVYSSGAKYVSFVNFLKYFEACVASYLNIFKSYLIICDNWDLMIHLVFLEIFIIEFGLLTFV